MAFPQTPLPVRVSIAPGADPAATIESWEALGLWTEITADVRVADGITITAGRQDEANQVDPSTCSMRIDNRSGKYNPRNPMGQWYGQLRKNTPLKVEVDRGNDTFQRTVSGSWGSNDGLNWTAVDNTGITYSVSPATGAVIGIPSANFVATNMLSQAGGWNTDATMLFSLPNVPSGGAFLTSLQLRRSGSTTFMGLTINVGTDGGVDLTLDRFYGAGSRFILRTQLDVVGAYTANRKIWVRGRTLGTIIYGKAWYDGSPEPTAWQVVFDETSPGLTYDAEEGTGFLGQNVGVHFWRQTGNTNTTTANLWTFTTRPTLFMGTVVEWPVRWDQSANDCTVSIQASGVLRRLAQGQAPLQSPIYKTYTGRSDALYAYWPLEDDSGSLSAAGIGTNVKPATIYQASFGYDGKQLGGSKSTVEITQDTTISGLLPRTTLTPASGWSVDVYLLAEALPPSGQDATFMQIRTTGFKSLFSLMIRNDGNFAFQTVDSDGTVGAVALAGNGSIAANTWYALRLEVYQPSGTNLAVRITGLNLETGVPVQTIYPIGNGSLGIPNSWSIYGSSTSLPAASVGHVAFFRFGAVFDSNDVLQAARGYAGETASARVKRLCKEQNISLTLLGNSTTIMGPQGSDTFLALLRETEETDLGVLYETSYSPGLGYRPRTARYNTTNRITINMANGFISEPPEPTDDDQGVRNDWTVSREKGSSAQVVDEVHIAEQGRYDDSVTINVSSDDVLVDHAAMRVYLGTYDELRWPKVNFNLAKTPSLIPYWVSWLVGSRFVISNLPTAQFPGVTADLLVEGWTHTLGPYTWDVEVNCSPAQPWARFRPVAGTTIDEDDARVDSDRTFLNASYSNSATSMVFLSPADSPPWDQAAVPFDINLAGERVTVTALGVPTSTTQTATVTRSVNGVVKAQSAGTPVSLWLPAYAAL